MDRQKECVKKILKGMTQVEIAKDLGISQPAVSKALKRLKFCPHCQKPLFKGDQVND